MLCFFFFSLITEAIVQKAASHPKMSKICSETFHHILHVSPQLQWFVVLTLATCYMLALKTEVEIFILIEFVDMTPAFTDTMLLHKTYSYVFLTSF